MAEELTSKDAAAAEYDCAFAARYGVLHALRVARAAHLAPGQHVLDLDISLRARGVAKRSVPVGGGFLG